MATDVVTIVSGLPRSGTSMMMKMLESGGMQILTDHLRTPDEDNPQGYYEFERVKRIQEDQDWLPEAQGKAVKMIAALLKHLPASYYYRVIFMCRDIDEVLASQRRMLIRRGEPADAVSDSKMALLFRRHVERIENWLAQQDNIEVLYVHYVEVLADPFSEASRVNRFVGDRLDVRKMAEAVDPSLYRQRG